METTETKRKIPAVLIAVIAAVVVVAIVIGAYCGFCNWVKNNGRLMPGTVAHDATGEVTVDLSKMFAEDAVLAMQKQMDEHLAQRVVTIHYGDGQSMSLDGTYLEVDPRSPVEYGMTYKEELPFLSFGALWLGMIESKLDLSLAAAKLTMEGALEAERIAETVAESVYIAPIDYTFEVDEAKENVMAVQGVDGRMLDAEALAAALKRTLLEGSAELEAEYIVLPAQRVTGQMIYDAVYEAPIDPYRLDDGTITRPVDGVSIDAELAQQALDASAPGEVCTMPLIYTMPDFSTCQDILFQDVLAENTSPLDGVAERSFNVRRAAELCNEVVIMPGEVFSYLGTTWNDAVKNTYQMSTGYADGQTVDMYGGGICQVSSAIYYCTVYANLETVWRANHAFLVTYVPKGLDATVYNPTLDYRFRNNTPYPIKIVTSAEGGNAGTVTVKILGTKTDDSYVEPEIIELYKTPWQTVYKPDKSIPVGTTKVSVTPYTGYAVDVYRCVYNGDGTLRSRTYENFSRYAKRDKVILFNPEDAERLGLNPDGTPLTKTGE